MTARFLVGMCLAAALCGACAPPKQEQAVEFRVPVEVREVGTGTVEDRVVATGSLRAPETVSLRADTAGTLNFARSSGRRLMEGDRVKAGQAIAEISGEEVRLVARTEATAKRHQSAERDHASKKALYDQGLLSEEEFRRVETALVEAKIDLEQSHLTEERSKITTPISGMVLYLARDERGLPLADGQLVTAGLEIARVAPTGRLIADVDLVGPDVSRVREGFEARVRHQAWESRDFPGRVARLAPALDPATRTLRAEVGVDNDEGFLRPGMFVEVTMIAERHENVPVVPREAVTERGGRRVVFVLRGQEVGRRDVETGLGDDDVVEIKSGLEPGERIVTRGIETLTDGTKVRVSGA